MRIDQMVPSIPYDSDIADVASVLQKIITDLGCESDIITEAMPVGERENIIYHMTMGSQPAKTTAVLRSERNILFYHGLIPREYFENLPFQAFLPDGYEELRALQNRFAIAFTPTKYLERELHKAGHRRTLVLPLPVDLKKYDQEPDFRLMRAFEDDYTNILSVGPIAPNKRLEDVIAVFNYYRKKLNPRSRLFLVGNFWPHIGYCQKLLALIREMEIENVHLTGLVTFRQLLAYYRLSRVFLCMSEYEGFSTPLVEAMYLKVPVIALERASVPEILGGAGCMIRDNSVRETARLLDRMVNDQDMREEIINNQSERVTAFLPEYVFPLYQKALAAVFGYRLLRAEEPVILYIARQLQKLFY